MNKIEINKVIANICEQIAKEIEDVDIENSKTNGLGMKIIAAKIVREKKQKYVL